MGSLKKTRNVVHNEAGALSFGMFSSEEIRNLSAMEITNPNSFNQLGHPVQGGLYDLRMGPYSDRYMSCSTCLLRFDFCPGHFGHIELPLPVVNPLFYKELLTLIRHSCISCHKLHFSVVKKTLFLVQQKLLDLGLIVESQQCSHLVPTPGTSLDEESMSRTGSEYNDEVIVQKLMDHLQNVLDSNKKPSVTHSTRNVEALRKTCIKDFFNVSLKRNVGNVEAIQKKLVYIRVVLFMKGKTRMHRKTKLN
ncbi:uncharacterized protein [Lepeophtheirus salmonis]|uniref:uncharacterized protein n=1 Tax=Lepeophtheirus salmonis TaxID=72036 RepID=UPI001AEA7A26|nr:DNA-directed RNA polymerase I subunit rpa1-like [Lepeophtheirus salmonis]